MASDSNSEANVGNSRWYCHACDDETEALTEVTWAVANSKVPPDIAVSRNTAPRTPRAPH